MESEVNIQGRVFVIRTRHYDDRQGGPLDILLVECITSFWNHILRYTFWLYVMLYGTKINSKPHTGL